MEVGAQRRKCSVSYSTVCKFRQYASYKRIYKLLTAGGELFDEWVGLLCSLCSRHLWKCMDMKFCRKLMSKWNRRYKFNPGRRAFEPACDQCAITKSC